MATGGKNVPDFTAQVMTADEVAELLRVNKTPSIACSRLANSPHSALALTTASPARPLENSASRKKRSSTRPHPLTGHAADLARPDR
jgi:hypothetical protein